MSEPMTPERLDEMQAALEAVPAPPWHWIGDLYGGPMLATNHSGWIYVMGFRRLGFRGAQPAFPVKDERGNSLITPARDIEAHGRTTTPARDVAIPRAPYDPNTVRGIDNPVAKWMEHSAQYAKELLAEVTRLRAVEARHDRLHAAVKCLPIGLEHDLGSSSCRERKALEETLSPDQRTPARGDDACPGCAVLELLDATPTGGA